MAFDIPYSVEDEPTQDWTIEQLMNWHLLQAKDQSDASYEDIVSRLEQNLKTGTSSLWQDHKQAASEMVKNAGAPDNNENSDPQQARVVANNSSDTSKDKSSTSIRSDTIHLEIIAGEYQGDTYDLQPKARAFAYVGRSQGKRFRDKGISLPRDPEISTTHGRFEAQRGKFYFVDTGSTNGSKINDQDTIADEPTELKTGMEITVGQTIMRVTVPY